MSEKSEQMGVLIEPDRIYTPNEAAKLCGVHRATIMRALTTGALRANRPTPRKTWILGANLRAWMIGEPETPEGRG